MVIVTRPFLDRFISEAGFASGETQFASEHHIELPTTAHLPVGIFPLLNGVELHEPLVLATLLHDLGLQMGRLHTLHCTVGLYLEQMAHQLCCFAR